MASALVLATTACSGLATKDNSAGSEACSGSIYVGAPLPLTGVWAENGQNTLRGVQLAAQEVNDAGGIKSLDGANLKVVSADTSSDNPSQAKTVTEKLLDDHNISALIGDYTSGLTLTSAIAAETEHVPIITQSFADELTEKGYKFFFQPPPKASAFGLSTMQLLADIYAAQDRELKSVAMIGSSDAGPKAQSVAIVDASKKLNLDVAIAADFPSGLSDATAIVSKVAAAKPDVIVVVGGLPDLAVIIKGLRDRGITTPIASPGGGGTITPSFTTVLGADADGVMGTAAWNHDLPLPGVKAAAQAYEKKYGTFMPQEAGEAWVAAHEVAEVMQAKATCDPEEIRNGLSKTKFSDGPASAMPGGTVKYDSTGANEDVHPILVQWQDGQLRTIGPDDDAIAKPLPLNGS